MSSPACPDVSPSEPPVGTETAALFAEAVALYQAGRYEAVLTLVEAAGGRKIAAALLLNVAGAAAKMAARTELAEHYWRAVLHLEPDCVDVHYNIGVLMQGLHRHHEAETAYRAALRLKPDYADAHYNLATLLHGLQRPAEAEAAYRETIRLQPDYVDAYYNFGILLYGLRRLSEAEWAYRAVLDRQPAHVHAHYNAGILFQELKRYDEAEVAYRTVIRLQPDYVDAYNNLGILLKGVKRYAEAEAAYREAIRLQPDYANAYYNLGDLMHEQMRREEAQHWLQCVLDRYPDSFKARWCLLCVTIPFLYDSVAEIEQARLAYTRALDGLIAWYAANRARRLRDAWQAVGSMQNFYLAYQGQNDLALQVRYGGLVCTLMADHFPEWAVRPALPPPAPGGKWRIGIASSYFYNHSNWKIPLQGWVEQMDRSRFILFGYHIGTEWDEQTEVAQRSFDYFHARHTFAEWCQRMREDQLHVLIFPGLGMDQESLQLAALRLAPIQCTSFGHPLTSGMSTMDYFLSSDRMEAPGAEAYYAESLVRLPNLSICYTPPVVSPLRWTRQELGLTETDIVFFCPQSTQKYLPQYDGLLVEIARRVPQARFLFLAGYQNAVSDQLMRRLQHQFALASLPGAQQVRLLPRMNASQFQAMRQVVDVLLDTPEWSGLNSTLELIQDGLPVVTLPGPFMRGRHTLAILRQMEMEELIADTPESYVNIAVRLALDPVWRNTIRTRMAARYPVVCGDLAPVRGLEAFLEKAIAAGG
ncbi:MAG: tetratricopeptide repeat protein [Magnetococcales bacterium]|nr:tetratricopeptide repeat protein [Magnetococcales bacterium]